MGSSSDMKVMQGAVEIFEKYRNNGFVKRIIEGDINYIYK